MLRNIAYKSHKTHNVWLSQCALIEAAKGLRGQAEPWNPLAGHSLRAGLLALKFLVRRLPGSYSGIPDFIEEPVEIMDVHDFPRLLGKPGSGQLQEAAPFSGTRASAPQEMALLGNC